MRIIKYHGSSFNIHLFGQSNFEGWGMIVVAYFKVYFKITPFLWTRSPHFFEEIISPWNSSSYQSLKSCLFPKIAYRKNNMDGLSLIRLTKTFKDQS